MACRLSSNSRCSTLLTVQLLVFLEATLVSMWRTGGTEGGEGKLRKGVLGITTLGMAHDERRAETKPRGLLPPAPARTLVVYPYSLAGTLSSILFTFCSNSNTLGH